MVYEYVYLENVQVFLHIPLTSILIRNSGIGNIDTKFREQKFRLTLEELPPLGMDKIQKKVKKQCLVELKTGQIF